MTYGSTPALRSIGPDIWIADRRLSLAVGDIGARMTVIRLPTQGLFVHSPVLPDEATRNALNELGPVVAVVAPNKTHHFFVRRFHAVFPTAQYWAAPGLRQKRRDIPFDHTLGDEAPTLWSAHIQQCHVRGIPLLEEVVFFHVPSKTLILTDLAFNFPLNRSVDWRAKLFLRLNGAMGRFGPHRLLRMLIRDRQAFAQSIRRILAWDFDAVVVSHGDLLTTGAKQAVYQAFARWL
ncbi:hypothetical protein HRbin30_02807 [bacterium HR30]|nr:hypothetical protein HRbin30_02807 [bacterium HR30]